MRRFSSLVMLFFAWTAQAREGGGSAVGDGGDGYRIQIEEARLNAALAVLAVTRADHFPESTATELVDWFLARREALAADIRGLELQWNYEDEPENCAFTNIPGESPRVVRFFKKTCLKTHTTAELQIELVLHEAAHHFGVASDTAGERFANQLAIAVLDAWQRSIDRRKPQWEFVRREDAPSARGFHTAVWTGDAMIVFGGCTDSPRSVVECGTYFNDGATYDLAAKTWTALPPAGEELAPRARHTAVWTGSEMLVFGGCRGDDLACLESFADGARYAPSRGDWTRLPSPPVGFAPRVRHTAVWTGKEMIVWGGETGFQSPQEPAALATGAAFDPALGTWRLLRAAGAPSARFEHTAVWTGTKMLVFGGCAREMTWYCTDERGDGGIYDPETDTWDDLPADPGLLRTRWRHSAIWTGSRMIVWGGQGGRAFLDDGAAFDPTTRRWHETNYLGSAGRAGHAAVWTGTSMLVWGGVNSVDTYSDIDSELIRSTRYYPSGDGRWDYLPIAGFTPVAREHFSAVWTGRELVIWGGDQAKDLFLNTGGVLKLEGNP